MCGLIDVAVGEATTVSVPFSRQSHCGHAMFLLQAAAAADAFDCASPLRERLWFDTIVRWRVHPDCPPRAHHSDTAPR